MIEENYGDFHRTIFESLAFNGRLTATQVAQKCHLPLRQAKSGLAGLIQLRFVNHHTTKDAPTIYSANLLSAYQILRTGRLVQAARDRHGEAAARLVATLCQLGFSTIAELKDRVLRDEDYDQSRGAREIERLIQTLTDNHFLIMQRRAHFHEGHDAKRDIELNLMTPAALARLTGTKAKLEHAEAIDARYRQAVDTGFAEHGHVNTSFLPKHVNGDSEVMTNGHTMQASTLVQPNYHKVVMISEIAAAQEFASRTLNKTSSAIISCVIQKVASPDSWSRDGSDSNCLFDMYQLQSRVAAEVRQTSPTGLTNGTSKTNGHNHNHDEDADDVQISDIERELMLLEEGPLKFMSHVGSSWSVHKDSLNLWLKQEEILRAMDSRLEPPAPRILRILIDKGMLEEKTLQEIALLGAKELRQSLSKLKQMGYLDLQEIPRDPHRLPNKTVFLWKHDTIRVANLITEHVYTGILRLIQMLKLERKSMAGTLEKIERDDVKGKEDEMLSPGELTVLQRFRRFEEWIWGEIHRLDSTVAILRDL